MPPLYVIDRSNNNKTGIDYAAARAGGVVGVIHKVCEGTGFIDQTFESEAVKAAAAGLVNGGYAFFHPEEDAVAQANLFSNLVRQCPVPVPIRTADVEIKGGPGVQGSAEIFIRGALINLLYSGAWYQQQYLTKSIPGVDLWLAAYGQKSSPPPGSWVSLAGWQFSSTATVPGVPGPIDLSIFDPVAWEQLVGDDMPLTQDDLTKITTIAKDQAEQAIAAACAPGGAIATALGNVADNINTHIGRIKNGSYQPQ